MFEAAGIRVLESYECTVETGGRRNRDRNAIISPDGQRAAFIREYNLWGEKWQGLLKKNPDGTTNYDNQANQLLAANLKGKLLIAHGTMDSNVPPSNTLLMVNALIDANKDFDLIMFPNRGHGFGNEPYMMRKRWDYFVRHLLGAEPPKEYKFKTNTQRRRPL